MALHDLAGQRLQAPLFELLGLDPPRGPADVVHDRHRHARRGGAEGARGVRLRDPEGEDGLGRRPRGARRRCATRPTGPLRVDANEGWTPESALRAPGWLPRLGVEFVEQPLPAAMIEETRELRRESPLPFYADESVHRAADIPRLAGAFDGINIKLMKCGGLGEALRMIAVARAHGMKVMLGCMIESSIAITAAAHLPPLVDAADLDGNLLLENDPYVGADRRGGTAGAPGRARPGRQASRDVRLARRLHRPRRPSDHVREGEPLDDKSPRRAAAPRRDCAALKTFARRCSQHSDRQSDLIDIFATALKELHVELHRPGPQPGCRRGSTSPSAHGRARARGPRCAVRAG